MLSQSLDAHKEMSKPLTDRVSTNMKQEIPFRVASLCSCQQCNSIDCFKMRYENANLLCTCRYNCKNAFSFKHEPSKKSGNGSTSNVTTKFKEDNQLNPLNGTSVSDVTSRRSVECNHEVPEKVIQKDGHKETLSTNSNLANKKPDEERYLAMTRKVVKKDNQKDLFNTNNEQKINKNFDDTTLSDEENRKPVECNHEVTEKVVQEDGPKEILRTNSNLANKKSDEERYIAMTRKVVKKDDQKDLLNTNNDQKLGNINSDNQSYHEKKTKKVVVEDEQKELNKSDSNKKSNDKSCCEKTEKSGIENEKQNTPNTCSRTVFPHKKPYNINFREVTSKIIKEIEHKDTLSKHIKSDKSEIDLREQTWSTYKDTTFINDNVKKTERSYEESYTRNYSVAMTYTQNEDRKEREEKMEDENPAATLSAQIMNLPCQDFKTSSSLNKNKIITKQDILAKLKEIYKVCSCKVCECIPGFSVNDISKDGTRGCDDTKHRPIHNIQPDIHKIMEDWDPPHSGCACYRCDRKDCRGVWKDKNRTSSCDCKPCDCVKFTKSFSKPCDCEPCQCAECASLNFHIPRSIIVAPVQGNVQQGLCRCEPCECLHCTNNYGAMASSLMREVSTGMASHGNCNCESCVNNSCQFDGVDCRCDTQNRIVRKPIDRSVRDYDLRRAIIEENSFNRKKTDRFKNCDTITMFAFSNNYSNTFFNKLEDDCHDCVDSECNICKNKERFGNRIKNSHEDFPLSNVSDQSFITCKCQPCECQVCCKDEETKSNIMKSARAVNDCGCDICDCITCTELPFCSQDIVANDHRKSIKNTLVQNSVENFKGFSDKFTCDFFYPLKKGKLLTPSMFEAKINSHAKSQSQLDMPIKKKSLPNKSILKINRKKSSKNISNLLPTYFLINSDVNTVPKEIDTTIIENNSIRNNTNAQKFINNIELPSKNIVLPNKPSKTCTNNSIINVTNINQSHMEANNNEVKLLLGINQSLKSSTSHPMSKLKTHYEEDLFYNRILSFEKSILQLQSDISQNLKSLAEISSKLSHENFNETNAELIYYYTKKSLSNMNESSIICPSESIELYQVPDKNQKTESKILNMDSYKEFLVESADIDCKGINKIDQNDTFSKGDNKMYTKLIKKSQANVNKKLRKSFARSRVKKISINTENKISDFINSHLRNSYRLHGKNKLLNLKVTCKTKSASTSYENCSVPEEKKLKSNDEDEHSQTTINQCDSKPFSELKTNSYINNTEATQKETCTIPELELNIMRNTQSISLQTNESRGYAALTKLKTEVSNLLNSPLLQLGYIKRNLIFDIMDEENVHSKLKSNLHMVLKNKRKEAPSQTPKQTFLVDKEINCNIGQSTEKMHIDMKRLVDFLITRTMCKSELTKPFNFTPDNIPKINPVKSSCEGLKASFLDLRRVSDHTVLVRWRMPHEVKDVQGYELQVDGRAVQKILSPTRCMAVLTCLPHCEKLLLTIRTLTYSNLPSGHHPAVTIVYCPREKRSRSPRPYFTGES